MSLDLAYATEAEYREIVGMSEAPAEDNGDEEDSEIEKDLKAISRHIEGKVGRFFNKDDTAKARIFIPSMVTARLWIDDLSEAPDNVKIDADMDGVFETTLEATDYELHPLNAAKEPEPRPYMRIDLVPWGSFRAFCPDKRVEVTGKYGWPEVPLAVKRATIHLTAILRLETARATRRIPEVGIGEAIEASTDAQNIIRQLLDRYKKERYV